MAKIRTDFTVIAKAKSFSVHGRRSEWDGQEWHWLDDWYLASFRTLERAEEDAARRNKALGWERDIAA